MPVLHVSADGSHPEPLHHVLLDLAVSRDVQDEATRQVSLVITHEHVFVLDVLQHQQLQEEVCSANVSIEAGRR